jgi:hypothetical protein
MTHVLFLRVNMPLLQKIDRVWKTECARQPGCVISKASIVRKMLHAYIEEELS